ncbi:MAG: helicase-related protein, partial [Columbia Basin potato purple top phytoplasma]
THLMKNLNPYSALIFISKKEEQNKIYNCLKMHQMNILNFSSDLKSKQRKYLMTEIKKNKYQYILASDLIARGLDLDIEWVINYDLPSKNLEFFQHRSGRTGRMGKEGKVIIFYDEKDQPSLTKIQKNYNILFQKITLTENSFREIETEVKKNIPKKRFSSAKKNNFIQNKKKKTDLIYSKNKKKGFKI